MTANDYITDALRAINGLAQGEVPDADTADAALRCLNGMMDAWNSEHLVIFNTTRQIFQMSAGKSVYTMGPGGDFNVPRPPRIENFSIINDVTNPTMPVEYHLVELSDQEWAEILVKDVQRTLCTAVWDNRNFPLRTLNFWPIPTYPLKVAILFWTGIPAFPSLLSASQFPPAYNDAIKYNLAVRLSAENFGEAASPAILALAADTKGKLEALNMTEIKLKCDQAVLDANEMARWYRWIPWY